MIRWLLLLLGGALLGGIVHLATIILLPRTATQDAFARLTNDTPANTVAALPQPRPEKAAMPFMDPAFAAGVCRKNGDLAADTQLFGSQHVRSHHNVRTSHRASVSKPSQRAHHGDAASGDHLGAVVDVT